jgi:two-component system sensor histidine kinase ChvG
MEWVTAIKKHSYFQKALAFWHKTSPSLQLSRLGLFIFIANFAAVSFLVFSLVGMTENRRVLVDAQLRSLQAQAEIIANVIVGEDEDTEVSNRDLPDGERTLNGEIARAELKEVSSLFEPEQIRALIHDRNGGLVTDSDVIAGAITQSYLPPLDEDTVFDSVDSDSIQRMIDGVLSLAFQNRQEREYERRSLEDEVWSVLQTGEIQSGIRRDQDGRRLVSVTVPVQYVSAILGTVTYESYDLEDIIASERRGMIPFMMTTIGVFIIVTLVLTRWIARPMRNLAAAAREVRLAGGSRVPLPDLRGRRDEIGDLGRAFNAMTNALYDRLDAIESFAADVSHEIKNPLTSIRSAAEILPKAKNDEARAKLINVIQHDVRRLDRLITDISNMSRLDAELAREDLDAIDLKKLIADIANLHSPAAADRDVEIRITQDGTGAVRVRGHDGPLGRVFINLIENAITFSPTDGVVSVNLHKIGGLHGRIVVSIEDEGPGIPPDNLETVFERFYTERPKGAAFGSHSGLGLAIVRQIVAAHGGMVWAENCTNERGEKCGARFVVNLPLHQR